MCQVTNAASVGLHQIVSAISKVKRQPAANDHMAAPAGNGPTPAAAAAAGLSPVAAAAAGTVSTLAVAAAATGTPPMCEHQLPLQLAIPPAGTAAFAQLLATQQEMQVGFREQRVPCMQRCTCCV